MRRMITGKQQEFVEELDKQITIRKSPLYNIPGIAINQELDILADEDYKTVHLGTSEEIDHFGVGLADDGYEMFVGDNYIIDGLSITGHDLDFYSKSKDFLSIDSTNNIMSLKQDDIKFSFTNESNFYADGNHIVKIHGSGVDLNTSDTHQLVIGQDSGADDIVSLGNFDDDPAWYTNGGIFVGNGAASLRMYDSGTGKETKLEVSNGRITIVNIPTADPHVAGALWNDNGTLKVSAGGN